MVDSPIKWHGGKHYLASRIASLCPPHIHFVEPFAGGLSVLLAKNPEGISEVANDLNGSLTNFWQVLQDAEYFAEFKRKMEATPFSEAEYDLAGDENRVATPSDAARQFFIRCRQSLAGRMDSFAPLSRTRTRRGMNEQASAWLNAVDGLPAIHERLRRVVILNRDALDVIRQQDGKGTLFYCDPPYIHESRASKDVYDHEMTLDKHVDLLQVLADIKGKFLLSGYDSAIYRGVENECGWNRREFDLPNNSAGGDKKRRMKEVIWANFELKGE